MSFSFIIVIRHISRFSSGTFKARSNLNKDGAEGNGITEIGNMGMYGILDYLGSILEIRTVVCNIICNGKVCQPKTKANQTVLQQCTGFLRLFASSGLQVVWFLRAPKVSIPGTQRDLSSLADVEMWQESPKVINVAQWTVKLGWEKSNRAMTFR